MCHNATCDFELDPSPGPNNGFSEAMLRPCIFPWVSPKFDATFIPHFRHAFAHFPGVFNNRCPDVAVSNK